MTVTLSLPKGTMLRGGEHDYRIERVLGSGSFGITYLASYQDKSGLSIYVAVKEFFMNDINGREGSSVTTGSKDGLFSDYRRKFAREAKNLKKLDHPNIIKVMEYFECNNTSYYTMEYLEGGSLDDYIKQHGALGEKQTLNYAYQIGEALSYMHSHKMLHLDLKPKNIMLRGDGSLVLIDFGLAKQYNLNGVPESSTSVGGGTPGYAPLEQANYHDGNGFPVTMDVYAYGATIYKMLTAKTPPAADEILNNSFPIEHLISRNISQKIVDYVEKCMAPIKKNRYQSVDEVLILLKHITVTHSVNNENTILEKKNPQPTRATTTNTDLLDPIQKMDNDLIIYEVGLHWFWILPLGASLFGLICAFMGGWVWHADVFLGAFSVIMALFWPLLVISFVKEKVWFILVGCHIIIVIIITIFLLINDI